MDSSIKPIKPDSVLISAIFPGLEALCGGKIGEHLRNAPHVDIYKYERDNYSAIVDHHLQSRTPCLIKGCFTPAKDQDEAAAITASEIEKSLMCVREYIDPLVWIEEKDRLTPLHFDNADNQMFVLKGRKVFILYSPAEHDCLYHPTGRWGYMRTSRANIEDPDFTRFPKLKKARPMIAVIQPGDMLYFPVDWSHHVYSLDASKENPTLALNYWFPVGPSLLWKGRSVYFTTFLWTLFMNILVKIRFRLPMQRPKMADPDDKFYKLIHGNGEARERYVKNLTRFLDVLYRSRKENIDKEKSYVISS